MKKIYSIFFACLCISLFAKDKDLIYVCSGINNIRRLNNRSVEFRLEYKSRYNFKSFHPILGASYTTKKQLYTYGGVSLDLYPNKHVVIAPNFALGYYNKGNGKDLGLPLEFRSGIEAAIKFNNQVRVGLHASHTSNASLGKKNPGLETLAFFVAIPI
jgi:lipid A 3-O-deacylase